MYKFFIRFILPSVGSVGMLFCVAMSPAFAQRARVAGLEGDEAYMELLRQQGQLKAQEDSTVSLLSGSRRQFENATPEERDALGREIVRLEGELFEVRNRMGRITAQVAAIEQDYIVNHLDDPAETGEPGQFGATTGSGGGGGVRNLFANPFFTENLSSADVKLFSVTPKVGGEVEKIGRRIAELYGQLRTVKQQYDAATDQSVIDSLGVRAGELKEQIEQVDALMEQLWLKIYHRKLDLYSVLLDRIGSIDRLQLEQLDQKSRQVRRAEGMAGEQLAPLVATYPLQKSLTLDYELTMAQALGLKLAEDSLRTEAKKILEQAEKIPSYPDIQFEPRSMIVYGAITKATGGDGSSERNYTTVGDIPVLQVPKQGFYYTVQIGQYATPPKSIDVFKGMTPVMYQRLGSGQIRYVAGGFTAFAEAQAAATQMIRAGLRAAVIAFSDGKAIPATQAKALEAAQKNGGLQMTGGVSAGGGEKYRVEIVPAELRLSAAAREIIAAQAPGKTTVRNSSGNEVVYVVGTFSSQAEAERLAEALRKQPNVRVRVVAQ